MKQIGRCYLNIPKVFSGPWLCEYLRVIAILEPEDLLSIPFKMSDELRINEMVRYPVPQWAAPGLVTSVFTTEVTDDLMALELEIGRGGERS